MRTLRVGMIGANWGLVGHLPAWRNIPGVSVAAICTAHEQTARKAASDHGIDKPYWDYRRMIEDPEIDIIDVGTRPALRYDMVMRALAAGKHVLNANPFALDVARAQAMLEAQRAAGVVGMVEAQFQWLPQFVRMKEMIDEGFLGDLYSVSVRCHFPLMVEGEAVYPFVTRPGYTDTYTWLADPASGASVLRNMGGHCLHGLIYLFGGIASVSADLETFLPTWTYPDGQVIEPKTHDTASVSLRFRNGGMGRLDTSYVVPDAQGFSLEAFGSRGRLRMQSTSGFPDASNTQLLAASAARRGMNEQLEQPVALPARLFQCQGEPIHTPAGARVVVPLTRMFDAMASAVRGIAPAPEPSFRQACEVQAVVEAAERSSANKRTEVL